METREVRPGVALSFATRVSVLALLCATALSAAADLTFENARFSLVVGENAVVKSLKLKSTGEELLDVRDPTPLFSVTQPRPFNNEIKLDYPNARTTYPANRLRRDGDSIVVGFDIAPYEARVKVTWTDDYIAFTLVEFLITEKSYPLCPTTTRPLDFTAPPVDEFRVLQIPVKDRRNFGQWVNVMWDDSAAVGVLATSPQSLAAAEGRNGYKVLNAVADRRVGLLGTGAALVVERGGDAILDRIDALERDYGLPRGVASRRNGLVNASIYFANSFSPANVDEHIAFAKRGGFRLMLITAGSFFGDRGDWSFSRMYPNGAADVKAVLDRVRAAGIVPGVHVLHTFISEKSVYVKGGADRRIALREHYTLSRPVGPADTEVFVDENPRNAEVSPRCKILKFGRELMSYEGFTTERPYRFYGLVRGFRETPALAHDEGEIGGTVWVCEYGGRDYYLKQDSDLQDLRAAKLAELWGAGMRFVYFDGSEGVQPPYEYHVPNAQYRMWKALSPQPIFAEGAAKAHFGWHMLSGANAFDVFTPEEFKAKIIEYPAAEAPLMKQDFTRVNFGWWGFWAPGEIVGGCDTAGVQPDMWEYGTSKAAAWDCPMSIQFWLQSVRAHPRVSDIFETMRRWEDVRAQNWLSEAQKQALRDPAREFHLYRNADGAYELHPVELLPKSAGVPLLRGFVFERGGRRVVAAWHEAGLQDVKLSLAGPGPVAMSDRRYFETDMSVEAVRAAFAAAEPVAARDGDVKISVPSRLVRDIAKSSGRSIAAVCDLLQRQGVRGFDANADDADLGEMASTCLAPASMVLRSDWYAPGADARTADCIARARKHGVPRITLMLPASSKLPSADDGIRALAGRVRAFVADARAGGIAVAIGSSGATNECPRTALIKRILAEAPDVRLVLDAGNFRYWQRAADALDLVSFAGGRIDCVGLRDWLRGEKGVAEVALGVGDAPNKAVVSALVAGGYDGWYALDGVLGDAYLGICRQASLLRWWLSGR